jgi:hypothetical protein
MALVSGGTASWNLNSSNTLMSRVFMSFTKDKVKSLLYG